MRTQDVVDCLHDTLEADLGCEKAEAKVYELDEFIKNQIFQVIQTLTPTDPDEDQKALLQRIEDATQLLNDFLEVTQ